MSIPPRQGEPSSSRSYLLRPTLNPKIVSFALGLCLPYVALATPLPLSSHPEPDTLAARSGSSSLAAGLVKDASQLVARQWLRTGEDHGGTRGFDSTSNTAPDGPPHIEVMFQLDGLLHMPANYVQLVPHFNGGFIVLSYAIAFVGSLCTLELLIRRTTNYGWRNQILLTSAGITFGAVSTFAMHFIFNNALSLHHPKQPKGYPYIHLAYDAGYTILSLVASCLAMTLAFYIMGTRLRDWWCMPGARIHRRDGAKGRRESQVSSTTRKEKKAGMFESRRSTFNNIMERAGSVAKWSMVQATPPEAERKSKKSWRNSGSGSGKKGAKGDRSSWQRSLGDNGESCEDIIGETGDTKLDELGSRTSVSTVGMAWEPRVELQDDNLHPDALLSHMGPKASTESLEEGGIFTSGYGFPPRDTSNQDDFGPAASSSRPIDTRASFSTMPVVQEATSLESESPRRGSLPVVSPNRLGYRAGALSRISSLPEIEVESTTSNSAMSTPKASRTARTIDLTQTVTPPANAPNRRHLQPPLLPVRSSSSLTRKVEPRSSSLFPDLETTNEHGSQRSRQPKWNKLEQFLGFDVVTLPEIIKIVVTGILAGCGVAAMHYIGQLSIIGIPYIGYKAPYVVGSVVIACGAVVIALYIMFVVLRPKLKHTWASKIVVAAILATAVCGMHFTGMMGTVYGWPEHDKISAHPLLTGTNRAITAIVACLAFAACLACAIFFVLHSLRQRRERARRRRVVVASVLFDETDKILVNSTDGMLPMCDIASLTGEDLPGSTKRSMKSGGENSSGSDASVLGMDLTTGHDAFVSALRMTWSWRTTDVKGSGMQLAQSFAGAADFAAGITTKEKDVKPGVPSILDARKGSVATMTSSAMDSFGKVASLSVTKFLERFALSSSQLAVMLLGRGDMVARLGVLYDQILTTGWVKLDNSNDTVSKGQLIFLVRRVDSQDEQTDLLARHFIFADASAVASALHKSLSVPLDHAMPLLDDIRLFCDSTLKSTPRPATVYAGVAIVQATPFDGLRVLLERGNRARLPMREICPVLPSPTIVTNGDDGILSGSLEQLGEAITWLEGMSLLSIITRNMALARQPRGEGGDDLGGPRVTRLLQALERAIVPMLDTMLTPEDMAHILPRLYLHPVLVPLIPNGKQMTMAYGTNSISAASTSSVPPHLIVFYANYDAAVNTFTDEWLPFTLFRAQNASVMASRITAANTDRLAMTNTRGIDEYTASEHSFTSRRPSRVQFDLPLSAQLSSPPAPTPAASMSSTPSPPSSTNPTPMDGIFGPLSDFSFPPKAGQKRRTSLSPLNIPMTLPGPTTPNVFNPGYPGAPLASPPISGGYNLNLASQGPLRPITLDAPRRSSLAPRSRFDDIKDPSMDSRVSEIRGVAEWDPEWLLHLLRNKLRADA